MSSSLFDVMKLTCAAFEADEWKTRKLLEQRGIKYHYGHLRELAARLSTMSERELVWLTRELKLISTQLWVKDLD